MLAERTFGRQWRPGWLLACALAACAALPGVAAAQDGEGGGGVDAPIEWNFRPSGGDVTVSAETLQERWEAPFAVVSAGQPAERQPRRVVVPAELEVARRTAAVAADSGETVAEVTVEGERVVVAAVEEGEVVREEGAPGQGEDEELGAADAEEAVDSGAGAGEGEVVGEEEAADEVEPAADAGEASDGPRTHRVRYGETWFGLARQYRVSSASLAAANPRVDPERLQAGTVLNIPGLGGAAPRRHTVTRGDTLFGIARRYGVSPESIRSANRLRDDIVRLGQTLLIPPQEASR